MGHTLNLKGIERRSYTSQFEDGLMDLMFGYVLLVVGIGTFLERLEWGSEALQLGVYSALVTIGVVSFIIAKKRITERRIGRARFSIKRKRRQKVAVLVLWVSVVIGMFMAYIGGRVIFENTDLDHFLKSWGITMIISVKIILVFSLLAYILQVNRLHLYGVLFMLSLTGSILIGRWMGTEWVTPALIVTCSAIIMGIGTNLFRRFLVEYPIPAGSSGVGP